MINFSNLKPRYVPYVSALISLVLLLFLVLMEATDLKQNLIDYYAIHTSNFWPKIEQHPLEILRLFTALFLHGNWLHWLTNVYAFVLLAFAIERVIGPQKFLFIFLTAGIVGNISAAWVMQNQDHILLGASGAVSGLIGLWLVLFPHKKISFVIPIGLYLEKTSMPLSVIIFFWLCFQLVLHFQPNIHYNIAWMSHLSGFTAGFLLAWFVK